MPARPEPRDLDDDDGAYLGDSFTCCSCLGSGSDIICMDDLCQSGGECIHGDGEVMCRECKGEGLL